ncbi:MAG: transcription antitermination factor NusB [Gammaproteobacteria bacterium]
MSKIKLRRKAREYLVKAIYQWQMTDDPSNEIIAQFLIDYKPEKYDTEFFQEVLRGVIEHRAELDSQLVPYMNRTVAEMDPVELAILRLAVFELIYKIDVPYRVVINEAVEQCKRYGATDGHKFVNGVLDKVAQQVRQVEVQNRNSNIR